MLHRMITERILLKAGFLLVTLSGLFSVSGQSVSLLLQEADQQFREGKTEEARQRYEAVLAQDSSSYDALSWLGNYYYLKGKDALNNLERSYKDISEPSRMQMARHQEALKAVYTNWFAKAEACLLKALDVRKNEHIQALLDEVVSFKTRLGLVKAVDAGKRKWLR